MVKEFTREELEEQKEQLQKEIEKLNIIIEASDTSTFEIMIDDIKAEMVNNVAEENWKVLKANRSKVEKFREIVKIIQNQDELLEEKKDELDEVQWKLDHFQENLFDQETEEAETTEEVEEAEKENECVTTGYIEQGATLYTGGSQNASNVTDIEDDAYIFNKIGFKLQPNNDNYPFLAKKPIVWLQIKFEENLYVL